MIEHVQGDLLRAPAEALVNAVNTVGVMGKGIAFQFKSRYPSMFAEYRRACAADEVQPGRMHVVDFGDGEMPRYVINFPTKRDWRDASRLEDIESGLTDLARVIAERKIGSIAIPPLGCGLGGLDWSTDERRITTALGNLEGVRILLFPPGPVSGLESKLDSGSGRR